MSKRASNVVPAKTEAIKKRIREGKDHPQKEWRVDGHPGLILITRPSGTGAFYAYYNPTFGKTRRKMLLGDFPAVPLADAIQRAKDVRADVGRGADPALDKQTARSGITFQEMAGRFLEEGALAKSTRTNYRGVLLKDAYPAIGSKPATAVTADDVMAICEKIRKRGNGIQPQRTKAAIGGVYRWGMSKRLVKSNPAREVPNQETYKSRRTRVPTDDEIKSLWWAPEGTRLSKPMTIIIRLGILLAQRRTEIAGAKVSELRGLDTSAPTWIIPASLIKAGKVVEEGRMKNKKEQRIYLSRQAAALFDEARKTTANAAHLFPADTSRVSKTRTPHIHGESVTQAIARLRAREGSGLNDIVMHDLRRAVVTYLGDNTSTPSRVLDMILHHTADDVTGEHYDMSKRERQLREAWQLWADHVEEVVNGA